MNVMGKTEVHLINIAFSMDNKELDNKVKLNVVLSIRILETSSFSVSLNYI